MSKTFYSTAMFLTRSSLGKNIAELVMLIGVFVLILVACVFTTRFIAGRQLQKNKNSNFKPIDTYQIAQNRFLQLLQIGTRYFVISVSKDGVRLIAELTEEDIVQKDDSNSGSFKSFKEILSDIKGKVNKHEEEGK